MVIQVLTKDNKPVHKTPHSITKTEWQHKHGQYNNRINECFSTMSDNYAFPISTEKY
jgi:hypothetical protein